MLRDDAGLEVAVEGREGGIATYPACVRASVTVKNGLVVLGAGQRENLPAVGDHLKRDLLPSQEFLDHHRGPRGAENSTLHAGCHRPARLVEGGAHQRTLSRRQAIGLDHQGRPELATEVTRSLRIVECFEASGGDPVRGHEPLCVGLGTFEVRSPGDRPEGGQALGRESVRQAGHERRLGSHDRQIDPLSLREVHEVFDGLRPDAYAARVAGNTRVAGRRVERLHARALGNLPGQGILASTAADDEHLHGSGDSTISRWARAMRAHGLPPSSSR